MKFLVILIVLLPLGKVQGQGIALIELFTSQGCSSCPAADKNLSEIIQQAEKDGKPVFGLSFHVDYWNYIGWKDPYSSKDYTVRQQKYSRILRSNSVYTPQMIVNGNVEFVGSSKREAESAIAQALKQKSAFNIKIIDLLVQEDKMILKYSVTGNPTNEILNLAIVERGVENDVLLGENKGKKLHHDNVVRAFRSFPLQRQGDLELTMPPSNVMKTSAVLYIQDAAWKVITATSKSLH